MGVLSFKREPKQHCVLAKFEPQKDITAYELAVIVAHVTGRDALKDGVRFPRKYWDALPAEIARHFVVN